MDGHDSEDPKQSTADMTAYVQNLLQQMLEKWCFLDCNALDEMGNRINELEQSINNLKGEMGVESSPSPVAPSKTKEDELKKEDGSA